MTNVAVIGKESHLSIFQMKEGYWVTGRWALTRPGGIKDVSTLVGGMVSVHTHQDSVSYMQGEIVSVFPMGDNRYGICFKAEFNNPVHGFTLPWNRELSFY